jgi:hypothetical protein
LDRTISGTGGLDFAAQPVAVQKSASIAVFRADDGNNGSIKPSRWPLEGDRIRA